MGPTKTGGRENHQNSQVAQTGDGICDRCQIRVCRYIYWQICEKVRVTSPTKWLPIQQRPFPS